MTYRLRAIFTAAALTGMALAAGCGEPSQPKVAPPTFSDVAQDCGFATMTSTIGTYFTSASQRETVLGVEQAMQTAWWHHDTTTARNDGFDILREVETAVRAGNAGSPSDGSTLTNAVTACMLFPASDLPADYPHDYSVSLTPSAGGAFGVRGGSSDSTGAVLAGGADPLSGLGTQQGSSWPATTSPVETPHRVLLYGEPAAQMYAYIWKAVPASATFDPSLIVGLCDPGTSFMVMESSGGILAYADAYFLAGPCPSYGLGASFKPLALARHLLSGLLPTPLHASALNPGGLGGLAKGFSQFGPYDVQQEGSSVGYTLQPHDATVAAQCGSVGPESLIGPVRVQATSGGISIAGVTVSVTAIKNNGVPSELCGTTSLISDANGYVTFTDLALTKTGAYRLAISGVVSGRSVTMSAPLSDKFNIRPAH